MQYSRCDPTCPVQLLHFCTDHKAVRWLRNSADVSSRLARWRLLLAEYVYKIQYRPGIEHSLADGVPALRTHGGDDAHFDDEMQYSAVQASEATLFYEQSVLGWWDEGHYSSESRVLMPDVLAVGESSVMPTTVEEFLHKQAEDPLCMQTAEIAGRPGTQCDRGPLGILILNVRARWDSLVCRAEVTESTNSVSDLLPATRRASGRLGDVPHVYTGMLLAAHGQ